MKRVKNVTLATLITVISAGFVMANDGANSPSSKVSSDPVHLVESRDARFKLIYPEKQSGSVKVKIYNSQNNVLLTESLDSKNGFIRPYDLSNLAEGNYRMVIWTGKGRFTREIIINSRKKDLKVTFDKLTGEDSYKLVVKGVDSMPVYVDILNNRGSLVADRIDVGKDFSRVYTFKEFKSEDLTLRVTYNDQVIVKDIN